MLFIVLGAVIVVAAAAVGIAMAVGGGDEGAGGDGQAGPCVRETFDPMGREHVEELAEDFEYSSYPATSGPHHPSPAIWNVYDRPVPQIHVVHNLEHGGVAVQYGEDVPPATVSALVSWYEASPEGIILAPLPEDAPPELGDKIALTAWTHLMTCTDFDAEAFDDFLDDYRGPQGDAPEKFPLEALQPGST